ncbi:MAG: CHAP domain-containing protein [Ktedonobacterales bacterium]|nr:CHAP domain-containing protein [Ktedonobacterales bacterium]
MHQCTSALPVRHVVEETPFVLMLTISSPTLALSPSLSLSLSLTARARSTLRRAALVGSLVALAGAAFAPLSAAPSASAHAHNAPTTTRHASVPHIAAAHILPRIAQRRMRPLTRHVALPPRAATAHPAAHPVAPAKASGSYSGPVSAPPAGRGIGSWVVPGIASFAEPRSAANAGTWGWCTSWPLYRYGARLAGLGNALDWTAAARARGLATGYTARVGAVVVFAPYAQGAGALGHVAIVEAVYANGWLLISESDFAWSAIGGGFGRVDYRYVFTGGGVSFIYV